MMPVVLVANEQDDVDVDADRFLALANDVLLDEQVGEEVEVAVRYVDEKTMADLNQRFMGKAGPTDVLSFPIDDGPPEVGRTPDNGGTGPGSTTEEDPEIPSLLGDIVICPSVAKVRAPDHAGNYEDELALLLVHGILHLLGMDHIEEDEAEAMEDRERELLEAFWRPLPDTAWPEHRQQH
jgi:probable rRNA maturation factor